MKKWLSTEAIISAEHGLAGITAVSQGASWLDHGRPASVRWRDSEKVFRSFPLPTDHESSDPREVSLHFLHARSF